MNKQERDALLGVIASIKIINVVEVIGNVYPNEAIATIEVADMPLKQLPYYLEKAITQLEEELNTDSYIFLSLGYAISPQQAGNLSTVLSHIHSFLSNGDINSLVPSVFYLIKYEYDFGFWDKSERRLHDPSEINLIKLKAELETVGKTLKSHEKSYIIKRDDVEQLKMELTNFSESKQRELQDIVNSLDAVRRYQNDANELYNQSNTLKAQIEAIHDSLIRLRDEDQKSGESFKSSLVRALEDNQASLNKVLDDYINQKEQTDIYIRSLSDKDEYFDNIMGFMRILEDDIKDKQHEIDRLVGLAADASLGSKFNTRKEQLNVSVKWWSIGALASILVTAIWIIIVFQWLRPEIEPKWLDTIITVLKTSPALFLMGFAVRQYSKERNLQEEYAFKSAVAMTISAYADKIKNEEKKVELLMQATQKVYSTPHIFRSTGKSNFFLGRSKETEDIIKELIDLVKNVKSH